MSGGGKAWVVATAIGAVEALKDQGVCRWNYTMRSLHQHANNNIRSFTHKVNSVSSPSDRSSTAEVSDRISCRNRNKTEERLVKVMELNSWGPGTVRF